LRRLCASTGDGRFDRTVNLALVPRPLAGLGRGALAARGEWAWAPCDRAPRARGAPLLGPSRCLRGRPLRALAPRRVDRSPPRVRLEAPGRPRAHSPEPHQRRDLHARLDAPTHASPHLPGCRCCSSKAGHRDHRRRLGPEDVATHAGLPVTSPVLTHIDLATVLDDRALEHAINEADRLDQISPAGLLSALDHHPRRPGVARLRQVLTRYSLELPTTELERLFLPIAARAGLPPPRTQARVNGFLVDSRRAGHGSPPRPRPRSGGSHDASLHPHADPPRARPRPADPGACRRTPHRGRLDA
jgi:hypothetical protein